MDFRERGESNEPGKRGKRSPNFHDQAVLNDFLDARNIIREKTEILQRALEQVQHLHDLQTQLYTLLQCAWSYNGRGAFLQLLTREMKRKYSHMQGNNWKEGVLEWDKTRANNVIKPQLTLDELAPFLVTDVFTAFQCYRSMHSTLG